VKDFQKPDAIILAHPRSGTHFLLACLASHPRIFPRGEFLVSYAKFGSSEYANLLGVKQHLYTNKPGYFNVGIVMYENIPTYLKLFGASVDTKIDRTHEPGPVVMRD
jgi:hypothetical protein